MSKDLKRQVHDLWNDAACGEQRFPGFRQRGAACR
jgi:hypothetical protein